MRSRFTAWLSEEEDSKLRAEAERLGASRNYVVRMAVRRFLGMPTDFAPLGVAPASPENTEWRDRVSA